MGEKNSPSPYRGEFGILSNLADPREQRSCELLHSSRFVGRKPSGDRKLVVLTHKPRESNPGNLSLCYHGTGEAGTPSSLEVHSVGSGGRAQLRAQTVSPGLSAVQLHSKNSPTLSKLLPSMEAVLGFNRPQSAERGRSHRGIDEPTPPRLRKSNSQTVWRCPRPLKVMSSQPSEILRCL